MPASKKTAARSRARSTKKAAAEQDTSYILWLTLIFTGLSLVFAALAYYKFG